jgi:hypothetical protein
MIRLESLAGEQRGIISFLGGKGEAENIESIKEYLNKGGYGKVSETEIRKNIEALRKYGYLSSKIMGSAGDREERFYLTGGLGAGRRARAAIQGRTLWKYLSGLNNRVRGTILILFGIGFFIYQNTSLSGAVVSIAELRNGNFILPFSSLILGGLLLFKSLKK